ncbi:MAG TPA: MarC family protein [Trichocoleus sp.]
MLITELLNWNEYLKMLIGLLAIMAPFSAIPTYLSLTARYAAPEKRQVTATTSVTVFLTLVGFTFFGTAILHFFAISLAAFRIAGGILLLILALDMIRAPSPDPATRVESTPGSTASVAIVPLAIPLLAGPGALSTVIIYASMHHALGHKILMTAVIATIALIVFVVLRGADRASSFLGETSLIVFNRIMGLIIAAIAIEFMLGGLASYFPGLGASVGQ